MKESTFLSCFQSLSYIVVKQEQILEVSDAWLTFTGYLKEEIEGLSLLNCFSTLLRTKLNYYQLHTQEINYLYTKDNRLKRFKLFSYVSTNPNKTLYIFQEDLNGPYNNLIESLDVLDQYSSAHPIGVSIYDIASGALLEANQAYLDIFQPPYNQRDVSIGKKVTEIMPSWEENIHKDIVRKVIETGESCSITNFKYTSLTRGISYWNWILVPVSIENTPRYLISISNEVTENLAKTKAIESQTKIIQQQKDQLDAIIENMSEILFVFDQEGKFINTNKSAREHFSKAKLDSIDDLYIQYDFYSLDGSPLNPQDLPAVKVLKKQKVLQQKMLIKTPNAEKYLEINGTPILDENENFVMGILCARDITESIEKQKLIEEQKNQLETVLENVTDSVYVLYPDEEFIPLNKSARVYLKRGNISKRKDSHEKIKYYDEQGIEIPPEQMPAGLLLRGKETKQKKILIDNRGKKAHILINATPIFDSNQNYRMGILCVRNITENILFEESLKKQRDHLYKIIDTFELPIIRLTYPTLNIIEINQRAHEYMCELKKYFKYNPDTIKENQNIAEILPGFLCANNMRHLKEMRKTKDSISLGKRKLIKDDGQEIYIKCIYQPLLDIKGNVAEFFAIAIDITAEVEEQKALEKMLNMKDEFLSLISHELRTPLTIINTAIQALELLYKDEMTGNVSRYKNKIKQNSLRLLRLVNNLLDITRANAGQIKIHKTNMDIIGMTRVITDSVALYAKEKEILLQFHSDIPEKVIAIDDEKYERILLNLLSNAIKFTPNGKSISIDVSSEKEQIYIRIRDKGIGIPQEKLNIIFERFGQVDSILTRKAEGAGIGLSLVKHLVDALGGEIFVESTEGIGSTFTILLPDEQIKESSSQPPCLEWVKDNLIQTTTVEFADIYFSE